MITNLARNIHPEKHHQHAVLINQPVAVTRHTSSRDLSSNLQQHPDDNARAPAS
jgi:hypothetical protein